MTRNGATRPLSWSVPALLCLLGLLTLGAKGRSCLPRPCETNADCYTDEVCILDVCELEPTPVARPSTLWGVDANYVRTFEDIGYRWTDDGRQVDPIPTLATHGARVFRLRIWVDNHEGNQEPGTLEDARIMAYRAQSAGLYVIPTLFMSRGWGADNAQDAPLDWGALSLADRADAAQAWARQAVEQLIDDGITTGTFGIGNETDYGFCGVFQITDDLQLLRQEIWPQAATLINATIQGIREAMGRENLEFILHISRGYDTELALAFFETMIDEGVPVTTAGLSYYPSSWGPEATRQFEVTVTQIHEQLGLPVFIPEYAYPAQETWAGWNAQLDDYSLDESGQAAFVRDLKDRVLTDDRLIGAVYWSPEEISSAADWSVMSLFRPSAILQSPGARLALDEL